MSTQQPPEGPYVAPQDPWEGSFEPGLASVPTDPIPEQRFEAYGPGFGPDAWAQPHPGQVPQPSPNRTGMILLIVFAILLLGGGGGYAAWYVTSKQNASANPTGQPTGGTTTTTTTTTTDGVFDPYAVKANDCIRNNNGNVPSPDAVDANPDIEIVPGTTGGSYKVLKIVKGDDLVRNAQGKLDRDTTAPAACGDTAYKYWYAYDADDDSQDLFFCLVAAG
jgi:hypothetical protein